MAVQVDQFGRTILGEKITGGGTRYFTADRSICVGLPNANDVEALRIFNETPPAGLASINVSDPAGDDLIERIERMTSSQQKRLRAAVLKINQ